MPFSAASASVNRIGDRRRQFRPNFKGRAGGLDGRVFHVKHSAILFTDAEAAENGIKYINLHGRAQDLPEAIRRLREVNRNQFGR